jgi:hypothetical protein
LLVANAGDGVQRAASAGLTAVDVAPGVEVMLAGLAVNSTARTFSPTETSVLSSSRR